MFRDVIHRVERYGLTEMWELDLNKQKGKSKSVGGTLDGKEGKVLFNL